MRPAAAPAEAGRPRANSVSVPVSWSWGCKSVSMSAALIEPTAVTSSMTPASSRSRASRIAVRGAGRSIRRAASSASSASRTSNSTWAAPRMCSSRVRRADARRSWPPGRLASGSPGRSSAAARRTLRRKVPVGAKHPVAGSRLSATPCPHRSGGPTRMAWTCSAAARSPGRPWARRWRRARGEAQRLSMASDARASCSAGSSGNGKPPSALSARNRRARSAGLAASYSASAKSSAGRPAPCSPT